VGPTPSPKVKRAAWSLLEFVRRSIAADMRAEPAHLMAPCRARLHDELLQFLDTYDQDAKYRSKK
jgi:hypothetical protein